MSNEFKVVINESLDTKLIDRVMWHMARDMEFGDGSATRKLLYILAISSPSNRKTILQYLPEKEWDDYVPANYKEQ